MSGAGSTEREYRKTRQLGRHFEKKGYKVCIEPRGSQLPEFLRETGYVPDLIAVGPDESIVIEVTSKDSVERLRELSRVSETIERQRGWQFVLVMTNAREPMGSDFPVPLADVDELRNALCDLLDLHTLCKEEQGRYAHAVLLSAWAIVEGILRMYLYGGKDDRRQVRSPHSLVRDGVMLGFLEMEDGEFLHRMASTRNRVAHGALSEQVSAQDLDELVLLCKSML